ncbi:PREDICTED: ankyrin repeat domain-containing protein 29-like, partial [Amphimedon queenslandica]|uniref:Ankyrin n=1 Tax=Amphimedon queenslandica TaxID=400682 RepID=A0AAN0IQL2_AMPQE
MASAHNNISLIQMLLQANTNPHLKTLKGINALVIASYHGNYEVVQLLISKGVDYEHQQEDEGHIQIAELLLKENVNPNVQDKNGQNAFMLACGEGHAQIVELLLKKNFDPNVQETVASGWNAFMLACAEGHTQIVELLLKEKVDPSVQNKNGWNAFMM